MGEVDRSPSTTIRIAASPGFFPEGSTVQIGTSQSVERKRVVKADGSYLLLDSLRWWERLRFWIHDCNRFEDELVRRGWGYMSPPRT